MFRRLQNKPALLEVAYLASFRLLQPLRRWMVPGSPIEKFFIRVERLTKGALFDCRMCGHCILHSSGMTCPMTCPKNMRNGPCGGVLPNGNCEIDPGKPCVWVQAWERSKRMPRYGGEIMRLQPPVNHSLQGSSAWVNDFHWQEKLVPDSWKD